MGFSSFNLDPRIQAVLTEQGFTTPTPIQTQAIPSLLAGKDVMGLAQTGTGKTAAFVLPMIEKLAKTRSRDVRALILTPTRELAQQVEEVVHTFASKVGLRSTCIFGGSSLFRQVQDLRRGVDIVVACPGRLLDHVERQSIRLDKIEILVLDEADQMFDMGFLPTVRQIIRQTPKNRQTMLFSATMPADIRSLAQETLHNPERIEVGKREPTATVSHAIYPVSSNLKSALLLKLLKGTDTGSVLVFVRTKHRATRLALQLVEKGFKATSLQGNLSQGQRDRNMRGFRSGEYQILVATDIAARGIDISSISHVVNFDIPSTVEAYTHRIGRTGRAAKTGDALTLVGPEDSSMVRSIERAMGSKIERRKLDDFDYAMTNSPDSRLPRARGNSRGNNRENSRGDNSNRSNFNPRHRQSDAQPNRNLNSSSDHPSRVSSNADVARANPRTSTAHRRPERRPYEAR